VWTLFGAIVGGLLTWLVEKSRQKEERFKLRAARLLELEVTSLNNFHDALLEFHFALNTYLQGHGEVTQDVITNELGPKLNMFRARKARASLHLDEATRRTLNEASAQYELAFRELQSKASKTIRPPFDDARFLDAYERILEILRERLTFDRVAT
jgi:hypothetical protein